MRDRMMLPAAQMTLDSIMGFARLGSGIQALDA